MKPKRENNTAPKQSHTPGPWKMMYDKVDDDVLGVFSLDSKGNWATRIIETDSGYYPPKKADAILIASAPELLEAAKQALKLILAPENAVWNDVEDSLRQAIAKAEGRA